MKGRIERFNNQIGSVTVEAIISLSTFMFAIVTILSLVNLYIVQAKVAYAINTTAKEISQYSYLYSLTGLMDREKELYDAGKKDTEDLSNTLGAIKDTYNEIEKMGSDISGIKLDLDSINSTWDSIQGDLGNIKTSGQDIKNNIEAMAEDPMGIIMGVAKLGAVEVFDVATSKLIAEPLCKAMCKRHLKDSKDEDPETFLKGLGVAPGACGYLDGLDFDGSMIFPRGSNVVLVKVSYDVKVIALLPIDFKFHLCQSAKTHGWLAGEVSFETDPIKEMIDNKTIWTDASVSERSDYIRHLTINGLKEEGYKKVSGLTDVQLYNSDSETFAMIASRNPLWSEEGTLALTIADLSDEALKNDIEGMCRQIKSSTEAAGSKVTIKQENENGTVTKVEKEVKDPKNKIYLVIPQDTGLKEKYEEIIAKSDTYGVKIEIIANYGNGARSSEVKKDDEETKTEDNSSEEG